MKKINAVLLTREIGRNPAVDLLSAELPVGDNDSKNDEHSHRVLVVDAISEVIVVPLDAKHQNGHSSDHAQDIHAQLVSSTCLLLLLLLMPWRDLLHFVDPRKGLNVPRLYSFLRSFVVDPSSPSSVVRVVSGFVNNSNTVSRPYTQSE